ncbi:hypothetical protein AB0G54_19130 [Streptomyces yokosukanensis]|uniref:hypothetical protein n=1 Tax=Streptomyces yokosukanensis TaxID=67386 RepID=UPI000A6302F7|nr:hypothetical protein [Streptomyces yokosukanensis]
MCATRLLATVTGALALAVLAGAHTGTAAPRPLAAGSGAVVHVGTVSADDLTWGQ